MTKITSEERRPQIVECGLSIAKSLGLRQMTHQKIADELGVTRALIFRNYKKEQLVAAVLAIAKERGERDVLIQAVVLGYLNDPELKKIISSI